MSARSSIGSPNVLRKAPAAGISPANKQLIGFANRLIVFRLPLSHDTSLSRLARSCSRLAAASPIDFCSRSKVAMSKSFTSAGLIKIL